MRLNKYLARAGVASRRKCDEYIQTGKIRINGQIVRDFSYSVDNDDIIEFNGKILKQIKSTVVYAVHKPKGVISTSQDTHGRPTVIELVRSEERLFTIGRLDRDTTGIIFLTNDGDLAYKLTHPKFKIIKKYYAVTETDIPLSKLKQLPGGIELETGEIAKCRIFRVHRQGNKILWRIIISEGKNREIKKIFQALGARVENLHRYEFAGFSADTIKVGKYHRLNKQEIRTLGGLKSGR